MSAIRNLVLEVGEVSVPVGLHSVSESQDVKIDRATKDGNKIKRLEVDEVTGEQVKPDEVKRGVRTPDGSFHEIKPEALEEIKERTKLDTINIDFFVPLKDVPKERIKGAYYLVPQRGASTRPLVLLTEAMRRKQVVGVAKLVPKERQHVVLVYPLHGGLFVSVLHYAHDFRRVEREVAISHPDALPKEAIDLAMQMIDIYSEPVERLDEIEDDLIPLKFELVAKALEGEPLPERGEKAEHEPVTTDDRLMDALRESLEQAEKAKAKRAKGTSKKEPVQATG